jgi:hypothetical protein
MGLTQSSRALKAATRVRSGIVQGHQPVTKAAAEVQKLRETQDLQDRSERYIYEQKVGDKTISTEVSKEDYEMLKLYEQDPQKAEKMLHDLDEKYRKEHEVHAQKAQQEFDNPSLPPEQPQFTSNLSNDQPRQFSSQRSVQYSTPSADNLQENTRDNEFLSLVNQLAGNIQTKKIHAEQQPSAHPKARAPESTTGRINLHPTRHVPQVSRVTTTPRIPGTFTAKEIKQFMDELKERIAIEQEKNYGNPNLEKNIQDIREEMLKEFSKANEIDIEIARSVITYTNSIYIMRASDKSVYGFWHKPVYPPLWGPQIKRRLISEEE